MRLGFQKLGTRKELPIGNGRLIWYSLLVVEYCESHFNSAPWEKSVSGSPSWIRLLSGRVGKKRI